MVGSIVGLLLLIIIALQLPPVQRMLTHKAAAYLQDKIKTRVSIGEINLAFPKSIYIGDVYLESREHDTLLYSHSLKIDIDMLGLLSHRVTVNSLKLDGLTAHVKRRLPDSNFNFSYIINAFSDSTQKTAAAKDTSKSKTRINVKYVSLQHIFLTYNDSVSGMDALLRLGSLAVDIKKLDLDQQKIDITRIDLENTAGRLVINKSSPPDTSASKPKNYILNIDKVKLADIHGFYQDKPGGQQFTADIGKSGITKTSVSLAAQHISAESFNLDQSAFSVAINQHPADAAMAKRDSAIRARHPADPNAPGWAAILKKTDILGTSIIFDNMAARPVAEGIDFNHLGITGFNAKCNNVSYKKNETLADVQQLGFLEKSGFHLHTMRARVTFDSVMTELAGLDINTGNTHISRYAKLTYRSLDDLSAHLGEMGVKADVAESIIGYRDILYFVPSLASTAPFSKDPDGSARLSANISGKVADLDIASALLSAGAGTMVHVSGSVKNLPDMNKAYFGINISDFNTTARDIKYFTPKGTVPSSITLPQRINVKGYYRGTTSTFAAYVNAGTSLGKLTAHLKMHLAKNQKYSTYKANVVANQVQLGTILRQQGTLGQLTMSLDADGKGLSLQDADAAIKAHVYKAVAMKYPYKNLDVDGRFANEAFSGNINMKDSNLAFSFKGKVGINPDAPEYNFKLDVAGADLQALHLMDSDLRFKGVLTVNMRTDKDLHLNGTAGVHDVLIVKKNQDYPVKNFVFFSASHRNKDSLTIRSDFLNADFAGNIQVQELPGVLQAHLYRYYNFSQQPPPPDSTPQRFSFKIQLGRTDLITDVLYPKIEKLAAGPISGSYNSQTKVIKLDVNINEFKYNGIILDSLAMKVNSDPRKLDYDISLAKLHTGMDLKNIEDKGRMANDSIANTLILKDTTNKPRFMLAAAIQNIQNEMHISLMKDGMMVNYEPWQVSPDNYIVLGKDVYAHHLVLTHKEGSLAINSEGDKSADAPMNVTFKNFNLSDFTRGFAKDSIMAGGTITGNVRLTGLTGNMIFDADMKIINACYLNDTFGNLAIKADNKEPGKYNAAVNLSGPHNNASVSGYYDTNGKTPTYSFNVAIKELTLHDAAPFTQGQVSELSGAMDAKLLVQGSTVHPEITGKMHFKEAGLTLDALNTHYILHNETINFNTTDIAFNDFSIADSADHRAVINGYVYTRYFDNFKFNLQVKTDHFLALNSHEKKDLEYYGKLLVTSKINIKGNMKNPVVDANAHLEKGTFMQVLLPESEPSIESRKGIVFFANINRPGNKIMYKKKKYDTTVENGIKGLELTSNIEVDKDARLKIIIDKAAGDYLDVKGAGTLSLGMSPDGTINMTGRYEILEGAYQMTFYDFVKRRFTIKQGGSITWLGTPMSAEVNLTAVYETRTAPLPILEGELTGLSDHDRNLYRQQLRFDVLMEMTGMLMKPSINLDISLNDLDKAAFNGTVTERLTEMEQDKSEVNKQVFALLVLNHFIDESYGNADQGNLASDLAYNSVSELVSQQLNALASRLIKKGSLSFDVRSYEDYSNGYPVRSTDFKATLQETFLNERLAVNVGGDVNVQGTDNLHPQASPNQTITDISIEYKLTPDGTYRLVVFRDNTYAGVIEGQLVETGAGIIFVKDFNRLDQLFTKPKDTSETIGSSSSSPGGPPHK